MRSAGKQIAAGLSGHKVHLSIGLVRRRNIMRFPLASVRSGRGLFRCGCWETFNFPFKKRISLYIMISLNSMKLDIAYIL